MSAAPESRIWPAEGLARVPCWVYQDAEIYAREQERIYRGANGESTLFASGRQLDRIRLDAKAPQFEEKIVVL